MEHKETIIDSIIKLELEMFLSVPTDQKSYCQEHPDHFQVHRRAQFISWSEAALQSYLNDLVNAKGKSRNLMTIKYARMGKILKRQNFSPYIEIIVAAMMAWQKKIIRSYPLLMQRARPCDQNEDSSAMISFETYLRAELETYSNATLKLLSDDIQKYQNMGINMPEQTYRYLASKMHFSSLKELEETVRLKLNTIPSINNQNV